MNAFKDARVLTEAALAIALAFVLGLITLFRMPLGGSISLEMVPLILLAVRQGWKVGMLAGATYGLLNLAISPIILHPIQVLFDYPLPFAALGLAGLFSPTVRGAIVGTIIAVLARFAAHFISGVAFFASYAPEGWNPYVYSVAYNAAYLGAEPDRGSPRRPRSTPGAGPGPAFPSRAGVWDDKQESRANMSLAKTLWAENADLAQTALDHRFVRGIADGTLPLEHFQNYVAQDAFYLQSFARAYALALAHSPDSKGLHSFAELLVGTLEELKLHEDYAARWNVDLGRAVPGESTLAYTNFLLATASLKTVGETCAAMTPCMRLYASLGQSLSEESVGEDNPYAEWAETYSDPEFEKLAVRLEELLDHYADDTPAVHAAYRRAMNLEIGFFEANFPVAKGPDQTVVKPG